MHRVVGKRQKKKGIGRKGNGKKASGRRCTRETEE
jgi:hypothetical protein